MPREKEDSGPGRESSASGRDQSSSGEERKRERAREERRATRRSHHPDARPVVHQQYHSEPHRQLQQFPPQQPPPMPPHREFRDSTSFDRRMDTTPRHSMIMAPPPQQDFGGRAEIYDPGNYMQNIGFDHQDDFQDNSYQDGPPPPLPPHRSFQRQYPVDPSMVNGQSSEPPPPPLRSYQSVPAFQQPPVLQHQQSYDNRGLEQLRKFHQLQQFTPTYPDSAFTHIPTPPRHSPNPGMGYDLPPFEDDIPPLAHVPSPVSSNPASRDGPPPPPPLHRTIIGGPLIEEPNWDNLRPKSMNEEHGLPAYDSLPPQVDRRPSPSASPMRTSTGTPLPPSLIPGIDPSVIDGDIGGQIEIGGRNDGPPHSHRRQRSNYNTAVAPLQIASSSTRSSTNYHRPQVEEVQDIQLYQKKGGDVDQILMIHRPQTLKKKMHSAPPPYA